MDSTGSSMPLVLMPFMENGDLRTYLYNARVSEKVQVKIYRYQFYHIGSKMILVLFTCILFLLKLKQISVWFISPSYMSNIEDVILKTQTSRIIPRSDTPKKLSLVIFSRH